MRTFVVPDIHGHPNQLRRLLHEAGCVTWEGERYELLHPTGESFQVISIGDLANAVLEDVVGDEACLAKARDWFDVLVLGNHEAAYIFSGITFNGYHPSPPLKSLYNALYREGLVVPAVVVGNTLLSHAGVQEYYDFASAQEALDAIQDVWDNYNTYRDDYENHKFSFRDGNIEIPKALLLDGVAKSRGGSSPMGGILWSDWSEIKNQRFSQVMGHTPIAIGPVLHEYTSADVFHLNIDCGAKRGGPAVGVWLDSEGQIDSFVKVDG